MANQEPTLSSPDSDMEVYKHRLNASKGNLPQDRDLVFKNSGSSHLKL